MPGETPSDPIADAVTGLVHIPSGPSLAAALACLDLRVLTGSQVVDVLKARYRQNNHDRAQLFAVIAEVMHRGQAASTAFEEYPGEFASDEVRAALVLTRRAADSLCDLAESVVRRLPTVYQAFATGVIDQPRVRVFRDWTCGLSDEHTAAIVEALLPRAHQLTTAQLMHEIKRYAIALDPTWARRRYERALKGRRVRGSRNEDGTANLAGHDLPVDRVAAACDRFDRLAKAAKQAGHPDPIDHVRADLFLGMTDGTYAGLTDPQILARLLADAKRGPAPAEAAQTEPSNDPPEGSPAAGESADQPSTEDSTDDNQDDDGDHDNDGDGDHDGGGHDSDGGGGDGGPDHGGGGGGGPVRRTSGLRLLVRLATLAGADRRPGDLIGSGPVHTELARAMAAAPGACWWFVLTGTDGAPLAIGKVRSRPDGPGPNGRSYPGLHVWLQVTQATLNALARQEHPPGWDRVITEITAKADTNTGPPNGDPTARLPGTALRRWITIRDSTCAFPGCRVPAHRADADHSIEHAQGGETTDTNLGPSCRHDHRMRHEGGWTLEQTSPGRFTWTSRLRHTYHRTPPPDLNDLPQPTPTTENGNDDVDKPALPSTEDWQNSTCMEPERPQQPAPPPPTASPEDDDPPPF